MQNVILYCNTECQSIWYLYLLHVLLKRACYAHFCFTCILLQGIYFQLSGNYKGTTEDRIFTEQFFDLGKMYTKWFFFHSFLPLNHTYLTVLLRTHTERMPILEDQITELVMQLNYFVHILPTFRFHCTEVKKIETHNQYNKELYIIQN